jgi:prolyl-tRNA synthetase
MSRLLLRTLRDAPADAEVASHQLLVRAGYIRRVSSGVYSFLPLGLRVLTRIGAIVRQEMDATGAQEVLLPALQPIELWEQTGRVKLYEDILFIVEGRGGRMVLGPTHEEVVTTTVAPDIESWRDLPVTVYQVQTKFRDEARPRFGLLRTREFIMKDAYSFDPSKDSMMVSYRAMYDAYCRIFDRCGLPYRPVEADSGAIGGDVNHEFMVPSPIGEDYFASCPSCGWAANIEAAGSGPAGQEPTAGPEAEGSLEPLVEHHTPDRPGIDLVVAHFADRGVTAAGMLKAMALVDRDGRPVLALVPGDREVVVSRAVPGGRIFDDEDFARHPELVKGYIGPMGMQARGVRVVADHLVAGRRPWVTGANRADHHVTGAVPGRDFEVDEWGSFATVASGDPCPRCSQPLELLRGVEAGHTFQLGLTYSNKLDGATFVDESGSEAPFWMGCYGIGVSRLPAVIAEASHDDSGLVWPAEVAPYDLHLISLGASRDPDVAAAADALYEELTAAGAAVLYDDRDASAGVKFADADLIGVPVQLIVGAKGLARAVVERKNRASGARDELPRQGVAEALGYTFRAGLSGR